MSDEKGETRQSTTAAPRRDPRYKRQMGLSPREAATLAMGVLLIDIEDAKRILSFATGETCHGYMIPRLLGLTVETMRKTHPELSALTTIRPKLHVFLDGKMGSRPETIDRWLSAALRSLGLGDVGAFVIEEGFAAGAEAARRASLAREIDWGFGAEGVVYVHDPETCK